ncbi:DUF3176 domain-containing protein [Aspergillus undulatus]|uniref:DUF3176 domain-containing protein n=1 Tax=Aspergillus undulatus TaxID=1810928 RepID=UPI003CCCA51B
MSHEPGNNEEPSANQYHGFDQELLPRSVSPLEVEEPDADSLEPIVKPTVEPIDRLSQILGTWFYEILAVVFSLVCFVSIVCVHLVFNQKPAPSLSYGLTLNAIISTLATSPKSSLIFVIGECIEQLKWV